MDDTVVLDAQQRLDDLENEILFIIELITDRRNLKKTI